jgi:predicted dehydrogenase
VEIAGVADPDPSSREFVAAKAPGVRQYTGYRELIAAGSLDAVVIAVPSQLHRDAAGRAFAAGLAVYLEKPLAASMEDGEAIVEAARRSGVVCQIGFSMRFNALYRDLRDRVRRGEIGEVLAIRTSWTARWPGDATWRIDPATGGGALLELASHHVDFLRHLFDAEVEVLAASAWSNRGPDEAGMLLLRLSNGLHAQLLCGYGTVEEDRIEVYGSDGKLVLDRYNSLMVERIPAAASGGITTSIRRAVREIAHLSYGLEKRRAPGEEPSFAAAMSAFLDAVRHGRPATPSLDDGLAALRVVDAARAKAQRR